MKAIPTPVEATRTRRPRGCASNEKAAKESKIPDTREDELCKSLKRKYASSILALKDEFLKKTKKLPSSATKTLKEWWLANLLWPYPSEDAKR